MDFHSKTAEIFIPDGLPQEAGLKRTTHMAISAHQDDIEIMASAPIIECFQQTEKWFTGVVLSDGRGSHRDGLYKDFSDEDMHQVRIKEQKKAAVVGEYAAQVLLDYPSKVIKDGNDKHTVEDLIQVLKMCQPGVIYTHNLADKHDTHVATALRVIAAIRSLPKKQRPDKLYGCEVWRNLDWMEDIDKVYLNVSEHESLQAALLGVFDSQICGGKRYDLAALGRRKSNATFSESHGVDVTTGLCYAMDLTPLITDDLQGESAFVTKHIQNFARDVEDRINRLIK
jgi:LmbE family N-acetylglucosaminyl deacetylase